MTAPTPTDALSYSGISGQGWSEDAVTSAFTTEKAAQANRCKVPLDTDPWPADLVEALFRRTAHNLALRPLPLGVAATITEGAVATQSVGGLDAEVRRLEAPYRKARGKIG